MWCKGWGPVPEAGSGEEAWAAAGQWALSVIDSCREGKGSKRFISRLDVAGERG